MATYRTEGIILKRSDTGEADRTLFILSKDRGLIKAMAKAARMPFSKLGGFLDLFNHIDVSLAEGKTFDVVTEARTINSFTALRTNVTHHLYAGHIAELVIKALHEGDGDSEGIFALVRESFSFLGSHDTSKLVLEAFRLKFLALLGYAPDLSECASCHEPLKEQKNYVSPTYDGVLCPACFEKIPSEIAGGKPLPANALKLVRLLLNGSFETIAKITVPPALQKEIGELTGQMVQYHLGVQLKSSAVMNITMTNSKLNSDTHSAGASHS